VRTFYHRSFRGLIFGLGIRSISATGGLSCRVTRSQNIGSLLKTEAPSIRLLALADTRFSLISRCTRRAHAAFYLIERIVLSLQSIIGADSNPRPAGLPSWPRQQPAPLSSLTAAVSQQEPLQRNATNAIEIKRKCSPINEANLYPPAHNGLVAGSSSAGPTSLRVSRVKAAAPEPTGRRRAVHASYGPASHAHQYDPRVTDARFRSPHQKRPSLLSHGRAAIRSRIPHQPDSSALPA
jgi:hypothetical protein